MRAVLYAHDLEPITVLELPRWAWEYLRERQQVRLAVHEPFDWRVGADERPSRTFIREVRITAETFCRRGVSKLMLFTDDEESALLLNAAFLPGQHTAVREHQREAFAKGFVDALSRLGLIGDGND